MLDAANEARSFVEAKQRTDLDMDRLFTLALTRCVEIIGEAASRVSDDTKRSLPAIPWADVIGMRNRLVHAYFEVDLDILWATVQTELPKLIAALEPKLAEERSTESGD